MKKFRGSIGDVLIIAVICLVAFVAISSFTSSKKETSYSIKTDEPTVDEEAAVLAPTPEEGSDEVIIFTPNPSQELKETKYSLDEVYHPEASGPRRDHQALRGKQPGIQPLRFEQRRLRTGDARDLSQGL